LIWPEGLFILGISTCRGVYMIMRYVLFISKILAVLLAFVTGAVLFYIVGGGLAIYFELHYDLPVANKGIFQGALAGGALMGLGLIAYFAGTRKWWVSFFIFPVLLAAITAYSVSYRSGPAYEYTGSSRSEILETLQTEKNPPTFLLSINSETRAAHAVTLDRPKTFHLQRKRGGPLCFAAGAPEIEDQKVVLEVAALVSRNVTHPVYETPPLKAEQWNEFQVPADMLNPSMQSFEVRVKSESQGDFSPLVMITELETVRKTNAPNIVLVMVDTFRADHLSPRTAPFLTRFMKKSLVMEQTMAPSSWTVPSTASVLTGLYPHQHGYISNAHMEFKEVDLISEHFKNKGYRTAGVSSNRLIDPRYGFARGFDQFFALGRTQYNYLNSGRIVTLRAKNWMNKHRDRPFFLYLHYMDLHFPYLAPPPDTFHEIEGGALAKLKSLYSFLRYDNRDFTNQWLIDHPEAVPGVVSRYRGEIRYWDRQFRDLVEHIRQQGLLANTIIVVVSDHGEAFGEHGNYRHGSSLYEEEIHVPLVIFDGRSPVSGKFERPVSSIETARIIAEMAGVRPAKQWHGRTLGEIREEGRPRKLASVLSYRHFHPMEGDPESVKVSLAARQGSQKIIIKYDAATGAKRKMLFDLEKDPHEKNNLWTYPESEDLPLYKWMVDYLPPPDSITFKPETKDKQLERDLKALGYVQ